MGATSGFINTTFDDAAATSIDSAPGAPYTGTFRPEGQLANLIGLVRGGTLSHQAAKRVFGEVADHGGEPRNVAEALGLIQVADAGVVTRWVSEVLGAHPAEVARYKSGEGKLLQFFLDAARGIFADKLGGPELAGREVQGGKTYAIAQVRNRRQKIVFL